MKYKTIIVSDLHLGRKDSKVDEIIDFLKKNECETLILNGDIIDGWHLQRGGKWNKTHSNFIKKIMNLIAKSTTKIIYLRGNHDDFLDTLLPFSIGDNFEIRNDYYLESNGCKYLVLHGDIFDTITSKATSLSKLGDIGYEILLWINRKYNRRRIKKGLPYKSISQRAKESVKYLINFILKFESRAINLAKQKKCGGIICGHVHTPAKKIIDGIIYLNSGDWVENKTALVEKYNGNWEIINWNGVKNN